MVDHQHSADEGEAAEASAATLRPITLAITNDPDHGRTDPVRKVCTQLARAGLRITLGAFCVMEDDGSALARHCHAGETDALCQPAYRDLLLALRDDGHEIAFHGYSQVSNSREKFAEGLELFRDVFGEYPFTYIEHGGHPARHPPGMCKREALAVEGKMPGSSHYVWDLIQEKIRCAWVRQELIDDDLSPRNASELLCRDGGTVFFRRYRMHYLDRMLPALGSQGGVFIGYTHFGYTGYPRMAEYALERWTGWRPPALRRLRRMLDGHHVRTMTVREIVERAAREGEV